MTDVLLGYEMTTGKPVTIPVAHMAVTGITQASGKTTTLEALIGRSGRKAITFVTKRGESAFRDCPRVPIYFREHCDWMFVSSVLEAYLGEKVKTERVYIMRACEDAKSLRDVAYNVRGMLFQCKAGAEETIYYVLNEYFKGLLPEVESLPTSDALVLTPGINVMDVSAYSQPLQGLVISSAMEWIAEHENDVITLIPEAWEFIPREHGSPCKTAAIHLARKGACAGNFVWLDSQDLASIDISVRKMVTVYLLGVQREKNEVKRTLDHIPETLRRPTRAEIMQLERGWFYVSVGHEVRCVYVQPAWLNENAAVGTDGLTGPQRARKYAMEQLPDSFVAPRVHRAKRSKAAVESVQ